MCILKCLLGKPDFLTYFSRIIRPLNANYSKIFSKFFFYQTRIVHFIKTYFKPRIVDLFFTTFKDWLTTNHWFLKKYRFFIQTSYFYKLFQRPSGSKDVRGIFKISFWSGITNFKKIFFKFKFISRTFWQERTFWDDFFQYIFKDYRLTDIDLRTIDSRTFWQARTFWDDFFSIYF